MAKKLAEFAGILPAPTDWGMLPAFKREAFYYEAMDFVIYLEEDLPYRADRVDDFLTLLWHPSEDRAIGVKLKGFRFIFERIRQILRAGGRELSSEEFLPLIAAVEVAMTAGAGATMTASAEQRRSIERYEAARALVQTITFDARELAHAYL